MLFIIIVSAPSEPQDLKLAPVDGSSISVTWLAPEELNGILQSYILKWTDVTNNFNNMSATEEETVTVPPNNTTYLASGLQSCQLYQFSVTGTTGGGEGKYVSDTGTTIEAGE